MYLNNIFLPLLTLSSVATVSLAKPAHSRRGAHLNRDLDFARRAAAAPAEARGFEAHVKKSRKGKRLVKKKKRAACQVPVNANTTLVSAASASTSIIGGEHLASASSAVSATVISSAAPSPSAQASSMAYSATQVSSIAGYSSASSAAAAASSAAASSSNSDWTLVESVQGGNFFDAWNFWSWDDPTHGTVDYLDVSDAWSSGLISINSAGHAIMAVDTTEQISGGRKSIRIHSNKVWTGGMVIMDAVHMPTGCGTWPAWWQNGPNWPIGGEIDILEGVNAFSENQVSLHTDNGCTMPSDAGNGQSGQFTTGNYDSFNCASYATSNQGCGVRAVGQENTYGPGFNSINGGVYAMKWDLTGISVWFFPRSSIPSDITNETPDPSSWGTPMANFPSDNCSPYQYFYDNINIFDTTLCGDWAGADGVWNYAGYAGQSQSCAAITGYSTCSGYVQNVGSAFADAYWEVSYVKYFNSTTQV